LTRLNAFFPNALAAAEQFIWLRTGQHHHRP